MIVSGKEHQPKVLVSFLICFLIVMTIGCRPSVIESAAAQTTTVISKPTRTQTASIEIMTPTITVSPLGNNAPTLAPTVTLLPTSVTKTPIIPTEACPGRIYSLQPEDLLPGKVVFSKSVEGGMLSLGGYENLFTISDQNLELSPFMADLGQGIFWDFFASPDHKWLIFGMETLDEQRSVYIHNLILTTSIADNRKIIPWDEDNWSYAIQGWLLDNEQVMIVPRYEWGEMWKDEIILYNPFAEQQVRITPKFGYPEDSFYIESIWENVVYDSTFTRVVYQEDNDTMVLWDVETEQELWRFVEPALMFFEIPTWSPAGSYLAVVDLNSTDKFLDETDKFQVLLVNREGDEIWRSDLFPFYQEWNESLLFSWSPDERYLVFRWMVPVIGEQRIFLLDTTTMKVLDYCINGSNPRSNPVWSPDSKQFIMREVIPSQAANEGETYRNVLVDLERNIIIQVDDITLLPVAWLAIEQ